MSKTIDFYFDFLSPYGYLAATRIDRLGEQHGREVRWRPFLVGVAVMKVMGLKPLMETPLKSDYVLRDIFRLAKIMDVPLATPSRASKNSRAATRAFYWIQDRDPALARQYAQAIFRRMWVEAGDITDEAAIVAEAAKLGLPAAELQAALGSEELRQRLEAEVNAALKAGVFGSPFFIADGEPFWGVDRMPMLERWLQVGAWTPVEG